tara:strand:- start:522 stop:749 length:228 start_codon:yes stop_codon:yes gene_type:complete
MKTENILADVKSKSLKDARDEIIEILTRLESKDLDLNSSLDDYQRLLKLNKHIEELLRKKNKAISSMKILNQNDK